MYDRIVRGVRPERKAGRAEPLDPPPTVVSAPQLAICARSRPPGEFARLSSLSSGSPRQPLTPTNGRRCACPRSIVRLRRREPSIMPSALLAPRGGGHWTDEVGAPAPAATLLDEIERYVRHPVAQLPPTRASRRGPA